MIEHTTARYWLVQLPDGREIVRRYQEPVTAERVLSEHLSALAAWPVEFANDTHQRVRGSFRAAAVAGNSNRDVQQFFGFTRVVR